MKIIEKGLQNNLLSLQILKVALPNLIPAERDKVVEFFQQLPTFEYLRHKDGLTVTKSLAFLALLRHPEPLRQEAEENRPQKLCPTHGPDPGAPEAQLLLLPRGHQVPLRARRHESVEQVAPAAGIDLS